MTRIEIPLFPLNLVLFPKMPLRLHIFEERYKLMMNECLLNRTPFGVVLIRNGNETGNLPVRTHNIGCTARIIHDEPLLHGRMNLTTQGEERFQILQILQRTPYLIARAETLPDLYGSEQAEELKRHLRPWVQRYVERIGSAGNLPISVQQIPQNPIDFALFAATAVQAPPEKKQPLLESENAAHMLQQLLDLYQIELPLLETMLTSFLPLVNASPLFSIN